MASPAFRSASNNFTFGSAATSVTVTEPAGAANGDIILASELIEVGGTSPGTINTPTDWTFIDAVATSAFTVNYYGIRRGGTAPTYQFSWTVGLNGTFQYAEVQLICISGGVSSGTFIDSYAIGTPVTTNSIDPPPVTVLSAETLAVAWAHSWAGWASAPAAPTNYTTRSGGSLFDTATATRALTAAGVENPNAFGNADGTDATVGAMIVIASQSAGGGASTRNIMSFAHNF